MEKIFSDVVVHKFIYLEASFYENLMSLSVLFGGQYLYVLLLSKLPKLPNLKFLCQTW